LLRRMADEGVRALAMEVSSHGLHQHRVDGIRFTCAVFTNLSQDHLDYHGSMHEYFEAKARLFTPEMAERAVLNADATETVRLLRPDMPTTTYGVDHEADVRADDVEARADGVSFRVGTLRIRSALRGRFNVSNCLAALATARSLGIADDVAVRGTADVRGVPGRVEPVEAGQPFLVLVDYAHTPDSVEDVLRAARPMSSGRRFVALGCGGGRSRCNR